MDIIQVCFFRDQLRSGRAVALANAEGFHAIIRAIELIGQHLSRTMVGMGPYRAPLAELASASCLMIDVPTKWPEHHTAFETLFDETREGRNDAIHQGAYARTVTGHAVELSIILEDALMNDASKVSQFMVRTVVEAKPWHPVSYVRQQMLAHAFSYLPIWHREKWNFLPEYAVAKLLRSSPNNTVRKAQLLASVEESIDKGSLEFIQASVVAPDTTIAELLPLVGAQPVLVVDSARPDVLAGLLTASDIL